MCVRVHEHPLQGGAEEGPFSSFSSFLSVSYSISGRKAFACSAPPPRPDHSGRHNICGPRGPKWPVATCITAYLAFATRSKALSFSRCENNSARGSKTFLFGGRVFHWYLRTRRGSRMHAQRSARGEEGRRRGKKKRNRPM